MVKITASLQEHYSSNFLSILIPCGALSALLLSIFGYVANASIQTNEWHLFYHDSSLSKGITHLRSVKVTKLESDKNGFIKTINPFKI